jgi:VanZ family protein
MVSRLQESGSIRGWIALGWAAAYVALGLVEDLPGGEALGLGGWFDGLAHLGATALLASLILVWRQAVGDGLGTARRWALVGSLAVGVGIELLQTRVPGRSFEWIDLVADLAGAVLGLTVPVWLGRFHRRDQLLVGGGVAAIAVAAVYLLVGALGG